MVWGPDDGGERTSIVSRGPSSLGIIARDDPNQTREELLSNTHKENK